MRLHIRPRASALATQRAAAAPSPRQMHGGSAGPVSSRKSKHRIAIQRRMGGTHGHGNSVLGHDRQALQLPFGQIGICSNRADNCRLPGGFQYFQLCIYSRYRCVIRRRAAGSPYSPSTSQSQAQKQSVPGIKGEPTGLAAIMAPTVISPTCSDAEPRPPG